MQDKQGAVEVSRPGGHTRWLSDPQNQQPPPPPPPQQNQDSQEDQKDEEEKEDEDDKEDENEQDQIREKFIFDAECGLIDEKLLFLRSKLRDIKERLGEQKMLYFQKIEADTSNRCFQKKKQVKSATAQEAIYECKAREAFVGVQGAVVDFQHRRSKAAPYQKLRREEDIQKTRKVFVEKTDMRAKRMAGKAGALAERIIADRISKEGSGDVTIEYMVKWQGLSYADATWHLLSFCGSFWNSDTVAIRSVIEEETGKKCNCPGGYRRVQGSFTCYISEFKGITQTG
uniref:Chromo domain-containing protein n=1 Tax=Kalanchoe fedtschenkoi TaxID=63787 RepID=A0A7N0ZT04_KALFE